MSIANIFRFSGAPGGGLFLGSGPSGWLGQDTPSFLSDRLLGTVIPVKPTITLPVPIDYTDAPVFTLQQMGGLPIAASRGGSADRFQANHTHYGWRDLYQQSHPEFFALRADSSRNWNFLCYSEPGVLEAELRHIEDFYKTGVLRGFATVPTQRFIPVLPDDNWGVCTCNRCQAKGQGGAFWGRHSDLWWDYVRRLADVWAHFPTGRRCPSRGIPAGGLCGYWPHGGSGLGGPKQFRLGDAQHGGCGARLSGEFYGGKRHDDAADAPLGAGGTDLSRRVAPRTAVAG